MNKLIAYLPCYNEEENIEALTEAWLETAPGLAARGWELSVVAIDDKSTDGTLALLRALERERLELRVIAHAQNRNLGGVLLTAIRDFLSVSGRDDLMCFMDGDNTHKPGYIFSMLDALPGADCVIASRYRKGAKVVGVPRSRLLFSDGARLFYTLVLAVPGVRDYTCGFRLYRHRILDRAYRKYGDSLISRETFSCMMELLYKLHLCSCRFHEVPFVLRYDEKGGASKMRVARTAADSAGLALRLRLQK